MTTRAARMSTYGPGLGLPDWLIFLRIGQGFLALLVLILSAVAASKFLGGVDVTYLVTPYPGFGFCWFAFAWTTVYLPLAVFVIPRFPPKSRPLIFLLVLDALSTLWWLVTFAMLADDARKLGLWVNDSYTGSFYGDFKQALDMTRAIAVLGAGEFIMFAVGLGFICIALFRKPKGGSGGSFGMSNGTISVQEYPKEAQPQQQQVPHPTGSELSATRYP